MTISPLPPTNTSKEIPQYPVGIIFAGRDPSSADTGYPLAWIWFNTLTKQIFYCVSSGIGGATWNEVSFSAGTITQYAVLVGDSSNRISSVGPGTSGAVLIGGGASSNPVFTLPLSVSSGGTGDISFSNLNSLLFSGTSSTGNLQSLANGTSGKILSSNGTSILPGWKSLSTNVQSFTTVGTFTYTSTSGMIFCMIEVIGGGGGGGATVNASASFNNFSLSGGGGGGTYAKSFLNASVIGSSQSITVGAGGIGATTSGSNGGDGSSSSFGSLCIGGGGLGGAGSVLNRPFTFFSVSTGGTGQTVSYGQPSLPGIAVPVVFYQAGSGGSSFLGSGSPGGQEKWTGSPQNGQAFLGLGYGAGGCGNFSVNSSTIYPGASGTDGAVFVTEFILN